MNFPERKPKVWKYHWVCRSKAIEPQYPMYIVSKGRGDSRLTSRCFERLRIPYFIVVEVQDFDEYACVIDEEKSSLSHLNVPIMVTDQEEQGTGAGTTQKRMVTKDTGCLTTISKISTGCIATEFCPSLTVECSVSEEFVDRFSNVPVAGLNYDFFVIANGSTYPLFVTLVFTQHSCSITPVHIFGEVDTTKIRF